MPTREEIIIENVKPFLPAGQTIIEIGAGNGLVAQALADATAADFTLLDVVDYNQSKLPMRVYDGKKIPFPDNSFDYALLIFVLHHNPDPRPVRHRTLQGSSPVFTSRDR